MVIVKLWGGIGNQLFQYVFGQYVRYRYQQVVVYDDNSYISTDKLRKRELDGLNVDISYDNHCAFSKYAGMKGRLMRYLYQLNPWHTFVGLSEKIPENFDAKKEYYLQAYWQDVKYYDWLKTNYNFDLKIKEFPRQLSELKSEILANANSVSIHVRRGDYFKPQFVNLYGLCTEKYYEQAISMIIKEIQDAHFYLFSDDLEWSKSHIDLKENVTYIPNYDICQFAYIELMSLCHHHIISNSSFSWWGAVLNERSDSIVISPNKWLRGSDTTLALDKWKKIIVS